VSAEPAAHDGRRGLRVTLAPAAIPAYNAQQTAPTPIPGAAATAAGGPGVETLAIVSGSELGNGIIEVDLAGEPRPGVGPGARGFVGVAFRVQADRRTYDAFYLRPSNARVDDQERRNHSTQYISHPAWPWERLRRETPGRYESYVDLRPGAWTHVKIEVDGEQARLFVGDAGQPVLIVNDLKSGAQASGQVALWIEGSTLAHFANLSISRR
jgi:hypothetical protein